MSLLRWLLLVIVLVAAAAAMYCFRRPPAFEPSRLSYVTTAHQLGVVGYRDPAGALSFDGRRVAFTEGRRLFEMLAAGGARILLAEGEGQIRYLAPGRGSAWIFEDAATPVRWWLVDAGGAKRALFGDRVELQASDGDARVRINALRQLTLSPDGEWIAGTATTAGPALWKIAADGSRAEVAHPPSSIAWPAFTKSSELGCAMMTERGARLSLPCGQPAMAFAPDIEVIGPIAFSPVEPTVFFASPNGDGFVDLWRGDLDTRRAHRLTSFSRDSYAPSVAADGRVLFKTQSYRTSVAELDLTSGTVQQLSTLQAETPSYHPDGRRIAVTYGTWRRVIDDAKYPDIAQEIGVIAARPIDTPAEQPLEIVADSDSEDQAMAWSPNGKWIVLHSHREQSDDIWLRPVDRHAPDRRVSFLGRGAEVGWPRWSPDGRSVLYDGASPSLGRSALFVIGIDQESGAITAEPREVTTAGFDGDITHGEWLPDSQTIVAIAKEAPGRHAIVTVPTGGGEVRVVHRFASEHDFPGLGIAPDGSRVVFVAPAADGFHQIFALPIAGGAAEQLTSDRSHKSQPAWSPDGKRVAFTVWSYEAQFWLLPRDRQ